MPRNLTMDKYKLHAYVYGEGHTHPDNWPEEDVKMIRDFMDRHNIVRMEITDVQKIIL